MEKKTIAENKNSEQIMVLPTVGMVILEICNICFFIWCLITGYANYTYLGNEKICMFSSVIFLCEVAVFERKLPDAMHRLCNLFYGMTLAIVFFSAKDLTYPVILLIMLWYFWESILLCDDLEKTLGDLCKSIFYMSLFLEILFIFCAFGGSEKDLRVPICIAAAVLSAGFIGNLVRCMLSSMLSGYKHQKEKQFSKNKIFLLKIALYTLLFIGGCLYEYWQVLVVVLFGLVFDVFIRFHSLDIKYKEIKPVSYFIGWITLFIFLVSLGCSFMSAEVYQILLHADLQETVLDANKIWEQADSLEDMQLNADGSITSLGSDPKIFLYWKDLGVKQVPHNIILKIDSMTYIYERGELFSFDNDVIKVKKFDLHVGNNNIPLEHLPEENEYIRLDLTSYSDATFKIKEIRLNSFEPYYEKIRGVSKLLVVFFGCMEILILLWKRKIYGRNRE